jgi:8-oxo-dGTP pyrophosphatase MutT (NUDIX family)
MADASSRPPAEAGGAGSLLPWKENGRKVEYDCGWFSVHRHDRQSQASGVEHDFYLIETRDWINVIPVLPDGRIVFVKQYRQAAERFGLEVPAGIIDEGEDMLEAGRRELAEETGFGEGEWTFLGSFYSNPALIRNHVHVFVARNIRPVAEQSLDEEEEIDVVLLDRQQVRQAIFDGTIHNAVTLAVLYRASLDGVL